MMHPKEASITYLDHSGFAVEVQDHMLIFDYSNDQGEERTLRQGVVAAQALAAYAHVDVFVSHGHSDHYNPVIHSWQRGCPNMRCFMSYDIQAEHGGIVLRPGDALQVEDMQVRAYGSTDLGCSYLIDVAGLRIFHAGDLNWWHWREESTPREIEQSEVEFKQEMEPIIAQAKEKAFDIAFFPLDPRQRSFFDAGANYFMLSVKPHVLIPMHTMGNGAVASEFARHNEEKNVRIIPMTTRGQQHHYRQGEGRP